MTLTPGALPSRRASPRRHCGAAGRCTGGPPRWPGGSAGPAHHTRTAAATSAGWAHWASSRTAVWRWFSHTGESSEGRPRTCRHDRSMYSCGDSAGDRVSMGTVESFQFRLILGLGLTWVFNLLTWLNKSVCYRLIYHHTFLTKSCSSHMPCTPSFMRLSPGGPLGRLNSLLIKTHTQNAQDTGKFKLTSGVEGVCEVDIVPHPKNSLIPLVHLLFYALQQMLLNFSTFLHFLNISQVAFLYHHLYI